jgi:hypothetical protein
LSEVDTILLDSDQFCAFKPQDVPRLPPHLKIAIIARGDCDYNKVSFCAKLPYGYLII